MMKIEFLLVMLLITLSTSLKAQKVEKLWATTPPSSNEITEPESIKEGRVSNVVDPTITMYLPDNTVPNTHGAVIICPGGGYGILAIEHEGYQFAEWLQKQGIAAFVLKYRLPNKHKEVPIDDAQQAIRYVRENCKKLGVDSDKIGIAGFSAGGHLASTVSTHYSSTELRPSFSILFYPVITMGENTHMGSRDNLLGDHPTQAELYIYSNEKQVNANTPPALLMLSDDDKSVPPINSINYYNALKRNDVPATMYIFPEGGHGWGMHDTFKYHTEMLQLLKMWLDKTLQ